jgi:hypothetical protein
MRYPPGIREERERVCEKKGMILSFFFVLGRPVRGQSLDKTPKSLKVCNKTGCMMKRNYTS